MYLPNMTLSDLRREYAKDYPRLRSRAIQTAVARVQQMARRGEVRRTETLELVCPETRNRYFLTVTLDRRQTDMLWNVGSPMMTAEGLQLLLIHERPNDPERPVTFIILRPHALRRFQERLGVMEAGDRLLRRVMRNTLHMTPLPISRRYDLALPEGSPDDYADDQARHEALTRAIAQERHRFAVSPAGIWLCGCPGDRPPYDDGLLIARTFISRHMLIRKQRAILQIIAASMLGPGGWTQEQVDYYLDTSKEIRLK